MTMTVRLPMRVEEALATYCVENRVTKSEVIVNLLEQRFMGAAADSTPYELAEATGFIGCIDGARNTAANAKKLIRQKLRAKHPR